MLLGGATSQPASANSPLCLGLLLWTSLIARRRLILALLGGRERFVVVGLLHDLGHALAVDDPAVLAENHQSAGR